MQTPDAPLRQSAMTPRNLVAVIGVLEARRADLVVLGEPTEDIDRQLRRARLRLMHGEFNISPRGLR